MYRIPVDSKICRFNEFRVSTYYFVGFGATGILLGRKYLLSSYHIGTWTLWGSVRFKLRHRGFGVQGFRVLGTGLMGFQALDSRELHP